MRVTSLKLANVRSITNAELRFKPGFNLVAGVNGVGKTSVLDALRACLSAFVKHANGRTPRVWSFSAEDIRVGASALDVECCAQIGSRDHRYLVHKVREGLVSPSAKRGKPREETYDTPEKTSFLGAPPDRVTGDEPEGRPLAVLFSTNRSHPSSGAPTKRAMDGGTATAFADALSKRMFRLGEIAHWMRVQEALRSDREQSANALDAVDEAVSRFLPGYTRLRPDDTNGSKLLIDGFGGPVAVHRMSDGERGVLGMVLDLARRLTQANPEMRHPVTEAQAVVLIDELELHLHPAWQRRIVQSLTKTFPKCQFIATTHSPQIIGEVEQARIQIIVDGEVGSPSRSFGLDSNGVLEEIMGTGRRTAPIQGLISRVSEALGFEDYDEARALLSELAGRVGEDDTEVIRIRTLLNLLDEDE